MIAGVIAVGLAAVVMLPMVASAVPNRACEPASTASVARCAATCATEAGCAAGASCAFVDENGNGTCDRLEIAGASSDRSACPGFVDENGDGICDHGTCDRAAAGASDGVSGAGCAPWRGGCQGAAGNACPLSEGRQSSDDAAPAYRGHHGGHHGGHGCRR